MEDGIKLFSLPMYAFDEKRHYEIIMKEKKRFVEALSEECKKDPNHVQNCCYIHLHDYATWDYNYVVGYISVCLSSSARDIYLELYRPSEDKKRFRWNSRKKIFLTKDTVLGQHFPCEGISNEEIIHKLDLLIDGVSELYGYERFYLDKRSYENVKQYLDFKRIIEIIRLRNQGYSIMPEIQ